MDNDGASRTSPASRLVFGLWTACALGVILFLIFGVSWLRPPNDGQAPPVPTEAPQADAPAPAPPAADAGGVPYPEYEETLGAPILQVSRQVDYAIMASLLLAGHPPSHLTLSQAALRRFHDEPYLHQDLILELDSDPAKFAASLEKSVAKWAPQAVLHGLDGTWTVTVAGQETHRIVLSAIPSANGAALTGDAHGARLALVIDDMGQDMDMAEALADLDQPPTFAVLPGTPHSAEVARLAAGHGIELLLHLPMEPRGYPAVNPGPGALFTTMDAAELKRVLADDLGQVPGAVGVNNHMGSRLTQDQAAMDVILAQLAARGLFFLDSLTTPGSAAASAARKSGTVLHKRDVFLDNVRDTETIMRQLAKAERMALSHGQAVAIGHPYPETLAAIRRWQEAGTRVRLAPLSALKPAS